MKDPDPVPLGPNLPPPLKGMISKPKRSTRSLSSKPEVSVGSKKLRNVSNHIRERFLKRVLNDAEKKQRMDVNAQKTANMDHGENSDARGRGGMNGRGFGDKRFNKNYDVHYVPVKKNRAARPVSDKETDKNRFEKPNKSRILVERDFVKRISLEHNDDLERDVSNEEIKRAVWDCSIDKAPMLDGFTFEISKGGNSSFITLIPKVPNANMVKDFRPISLIGSLYKVIAKVLANRLVTNKKKQSMIFKVDFEKAYDSVRWDFINDILRRFGFREKWCKWIQSCLYSSGGSVLVNGSPTKEFEFHKGLKHGDLLSSFLFILVMKSLHVSFQRMVDADSNKVKHAAAKIGAILIYHMSISKVPMKVIQNMESMRARFFNGADVNSKTLSWDRWKSVLAAKDVGVVKALHGEDRKISNKVQPRYPSTWLNIINKIESLKLHGIDLVSFITPKLGNGVNISFWDVAWCGDIAFKNLVSRLYALESMKNIEVASKLSYGGLEFSFRRNSRGGVEQAQFERLKEMVEGVTLNEAEIERRLEWESIKEMIDEACEKGLRISIEENSDWSEELWDYFRVKMQELVRKENVVELKLKIKNLENQISHSNKIIAKESKTKAEAMVKSMMIEKSLTENQAFTKAYEEVYKDKQDRIKEMIMNK
nr:RNA-directed DNA polymerase, eukaryota, reverse transcriptase zinc-binding domain protein [Tanacetum cinerariifolium]